jgi:DNA-binding transcriptional ArsR family regulator
MKKKTLSEEKLDLIFLALSNQTRRKMLLKLRSGETSIKKLAEEIVAEMSMPAITKHLKVLEKAGLISRSRNAQVRPAKLETEPLEEAASWLDEYKQFWNHNFDRLEAILDENSIKEQEKNNHDK